MGQIIPLSNDIDSTVTNRFKQDLAVGPFQAVERYVPPLCAMEEVFFGSIWCMISPLLTTDDAVMLRKVTSRWIEENKYRALGDFFFMMLQSDLNEQKWHYDSDGNRVCTMLRKRSPIMDSFHKRGLHLPQEETSPGGQCEGGHGGLLGGYRDGLDGVSTSPKHNRTRQVALGAILGSMTMATRYPVVVCPLIWEKCGDMAAQKSPDWDSQMEMNSTSDK